MDLQPLLETLEKVSMGRVLPYAVLTVEGDISTAKIPVKGPNTADKTDRTLRRFASDWLKRNIKDTAVEHRFEAITGQVVHLTNGEEVPLYGIIHLSWWPKPPPTDFEQLMMLQAKNRKAARSGEGNENE